MKYAPEDYKVKRQVEAFKERKKEEKITKNLQPFRIF